MNMKEILYLYSSNNDLRKVPVSWVIFGAGERGHKILSMLHNQNISIDYYCDNNIDKQGLVIDGIPCLSLKELELMKEDICVIVSPVNGHEIYNDLICRKFPYVISPDIFELIVYYEYKRYFKGRDNFYNLGHFYSLYPNMDDIYIKEKEIFADDKETIDIDLNEEVQVKYIIKMISLYSSIPKWDSIDVPLGTTELRYRYGNLSLSPGDAISLHCMLRIIKPNRFIEVGSGFTSAVTLDTNEFYLDGITDITFIEPYPDLLKSILKKDDRINLISSKLQSVPVSTFEQLHSGDILFIDSTHVSKIGSDVNYLFFEIFPRLKKGVYIHLHDIFYPFEYPKEWIYSGMIWNELYLLRAFLQNNRDYEIIYFQNMMEKRQSNLLLDKWPLKEPVHGGSFWMRKIT